MLTPSQTWNVEFTEKLQVNFLHPCKTEKFFITEDPTDWQASFHPLSDIQDLSEMVARLFQLSSPYYDMERGGTTRFLEGFGEFNKPPWGGWYESCHGNRESGKIQVRVLNEWDVQFCTRSDTNED